MLFLYRKKARSTIVFILLFFTTLIFSQTNSSITFSGKTQEKKDSFLLETTNKIAELKNDTSYSNARLQVYKVLSLVFLSTLICCLFLIYKKQKQRESRYANLKERLSIEKKKYYILDQRFLIIEKFEQSFNSRLETIINSIKVFKSNLKGDQQMLINKIDAIGDFAEVSANHYKNTRDIINTLK